LIYADVSKHQLDLTHDRIVLWNTIPDFGIRFCAKKRTFVEQRALLGMNRERRSLRAVCPQPLARIAAENSLRSAFCDSVFPYFSKAIHLAASAKKIAIQMPIQTVRGPDRVALKGQGVASVAIHFLQHPVLCPLRGLGPMPEVGGCWSLRAFLADPLEVKPGRIAVCIQAAAETGFGGYNPSVSLSSGELRFLTPMESEKLCLLLDRSERSLDTALCSVRPV